MDLYIVEVEPTEDELTEYTNKRFTRLSKEHPKLFPETDREDWVAAERDDFRETLRMLRATPADTVPYKDRLSDYGDLMPVNEWLDCCEMGGFIDYDGFGYPVRDMRECPDLCLFPSMRHLVPKDATHIIWFNR